MKVRYLTSLGLPKGPAIPAGEEADVPKDEAERLVAKGLAEPVGQKKADSAEKAVSRKPKKADKRAKKADSAEKAEAEEPKVEQAPDAEAAEADAE